MLKHITHIIAGVGAILLIMLLAAETAHIMTADPLKGASEARMKQFKEEQQRRYSQSAVASMEEK